ncbi:MAG: hypothetical protein AAGG44_13005, partial [Planctomycetota bacterium]
MPFDKDSHLVGWRRFYPRLLSLHITANVFAVPRKVLPDGLYDEITSFACAEIRTFRPIRDTRFPSAWR